ncbi:MAG TPA: AIR synthase-related protein, partial [Verrucomicrobiae bacterium]|nr:AIR synthase-related protein [Verrucomicrobiae bacterium]
ELASESAIVSAHDVSDGGLAVTVAESCFGADGLSAEINLDPPGANPPGGPLDGIPAEAALFGERGARAVVSISPVSLARVDRIAAQYNVKSRRIGTVTSGEFRIQHRGALLIRGKEDSFRQVWRESLGKALESA